MSEFPSPQPVTAAPERNLLELLTELVDAHADTVQLALDSDYGDELEWAAHCDYLRALQRLGQETLARYDQRGPRPAPTVSSSMTVSSPVTTAWRTAWSAAGLIARALKP